MIVVSGILSDSSLWGLQTTWQPLDDLYAHRPARWACTVRKTRFPAILAHVKAQWNFAESSFLPIPWVPSHENRAFLFEMTPARRGTLKLQQVLSTTLFPFGFFEKRHQETREDRWLVYPEIKPLRQTESSKETAGPKETSQHVGTGSVPFTLREYRLGDSARRIHWKASERMGRWLVNEMEDESDQGETLVVRQWPQTFSQNEQEAFISFLASFCAVRLDRGQAIGLHTPDIHLLPDSRPAQRRRILRYLALVEWKESSPCTGQGMDAIALWKNHAG